MHTCTDKHSPAHRHVLITWAVNSFQRRAYAMVNYYFASCSAHSPRPAALSSSHVLFSLVSLHIAQTWPSGRHTDPNSSRQQLAGLIGRARGEIYPRFGGIIEIASIPTGQMMAPKWRHDDVCVCVCVLFSRTGVR
ncbi:unnamed protein product [Protopolystoma xenopodis]|uniref:Uncharacterized protein n=1 Tax=Protopolystoma xenopodis TaxID=117903 RepID=A0A448X4K4_9PLAT|nr:unnamed protein product [Protopolystoma xenopodis]